MGVDSIAPATPSHDLDSLVSHSALTYSGSWKSISDAPVRWVPRAIEKAASGVRVASCLPYGEAKGADAHDLHTHLFRCPKVERDGEAARSLQKVPTKHMDELWSWADGGVVAANNLSEQGPRPYTAEKRKVSWGSRKVVAAERFAAPASKALGC